MQQPVERSVKETCWFRIFFLCVIEVTRVMKQLVKRAARPTAKDTRRGRVPYEPKKAAPFTLQHLLRMRAYCLHTIEVIRNK